MTDSFTLPSAAEAALLVAALSLDTFVASLAYGAAKIKIPFRSALVIDLISTGLLALSLFVGVWVRPYLPADFTKYLSFALLTAIGAVKLAGGLIKLWLKKGFKEWSFKLFDVRFILVLIGDSTKADVDENKVLSVIEAVSLSFAVSVDGLAVGFGAALTAVNPYLAVGFSLLLGFAAIRMGAGIGNKLSQKLDLDLSWLSGLMLILLAVFKLVP